MQHRIAITLLFVTILVSWAINTASAAIWTKSKPLANPLNIKGHRIGILVEPDPQQLDVQYELKISMGMSWMATAAGKANDVETRSKLNKAVDSTNVQKEFYQTVIKTISSTNAPALLQENLYYSAHPEKFAEKTIEGYKIRDFQAVMKEKGIDYLLYVRYTAGLGTNGYGPLNKPSAFIDGRYYLISSNGELLASERINSRDEYYNPVDPKTVF